MREIYKAGVTPQQKLVGINNKFGNTDIKFQQGTTRCLYDTLPFTTNGQSFSFFEDSASRNFPLSNTGSDGNKLGVGETMIIEKILFVQCIFDPDLQRFTTLQLLSSTLLEAQYNIVLANNTVIKDFTVQSGLPEYNDQEGNNRWYNFDTQIVIPPLLNYKVNLKLNQVATGDPAPNTYLRCYILGTAGILAPRTTF